MTDYNLRIKLLRTLSTFMPLLEERELVIVDDKGIGQASADSSLKVYDPNNTDIKQLYKTMKKLAKFAVEQPQNIQEGTTYLDKTDYILKRYNGTDWEIVGRTTIDFDNNLGGTWTKYINIPILTPPSEDIQYKIEINGDNILVYSNDGTTVLVSGNGGLDFWSNVQSDGKDIRVFEKNYEQNYFWIETFDYTNKKTVIWIKINTEQKEVNIAYGNGDCLVSSFNNGSMTFDFFDDFSSGTLEGWKILQDTDECTASVVQYNGKYIAKLYAPGGSNSIGIAYPFTVKNKGYIIETYVLTTIVKDGFMLCFSDGKMTSSNWGYPQDGYAYTFGNGGNNWSAIVLCHNNSCSIISDEVDGSINSNAHYIFGGSWYNDTLEQYINYSKVVSTTDSTFSSFDYLFVSIDVGTWYLDWIRIRKYSPSNLSFGTPTVKEL